MRVSTKMRAALLSSALLIIPLVCAAQSSSNLDVNQVVSRMEQARAAEREAGPAYTVTRQYQLSAAGATQPSSQVVAEVSFVPPAEKDFAIVKSEGNDHGVVHRLLQHEASMTGHSQLYDLSPDNYNFALLGRDTLDGHDCYVLQITPKREAVELIRGKAWVDSQRFHVRRIEGETAKSPSIWIKQVQVTISYGDVNGVWLETATRAVADVRLAGPH